MQSPPDSSDDRSAEFFRLGSRIGEYGILAGSASIELAERTAAALGIHLIPAKVSRFADGEIGVKVLENVREKNVFVVQSTAPPVNDNLMELLLLIDALRRASCKNIYAVIPYYGYARQDRKTQPRVPISAALVAKLIEGVGVHAVIAVDLHCGQIQGFFERPVDNLYGSVVVKDYFLQPEFRVPNLVVVSPDAGGAERADKFRSYLIQEGMDVGFAVMNKTRPRANEISHMELIGDVRGAVVIIVDDMIDTAGTLCKAAQVLRDAGAGDIYACASHGLFSGEAVERIEASVLSKVVVLDTVHTDKTSDKIVTLSVAPLVASAIRHAGEGRSVNQLFAMAGSSGH